MEVVENDSEAKVHYTGYGSSDDEWKDESDIGDFTQAQPVHLITPAFNLYQQLTLKIKMSLQISRKGNLEVRIVMDFDKLQFDGGIKQVGLLKTKKGQEKYTIKNYSDLDEFLEGNGSFGV